jgi:hypothetical protein
MPVGATSDRESPSAGDIDARNTVAPDRGNLDR